VYRKRDLPNYGVFDELRYFAPGDEPLQLYLVGGVRMGVSICEDAWSPTGPVTIQAAGGADVVVNLNASPYSEGRLAERERMLATRAADTSCALVYVNQVGGQDELVFDGASLAFHADGTLAARAGQFVDELAIIELDIRPVFRKRLIDPRGRGRAPLLPIVEITAEATSGASDPSPAPISQPLGSDEELYQALVTAVRSYVAKNGFTDVVLGLSGGVDSSLVAMIAVDALGAERVNGVSMPSRYSSEHSKDDAAVLADKLGLDYRTIPIEAAHAAFLELLAPSFTDLAEDLTEENLQARVRGILLMALSNKFGWLVLTTGNKSESAVGYSTLYGDTAGGFSVIKDVLKTRVYALCRHRNHIAGTDLIPESVLTKPPSAELRPDQRDDQSLPPYDVLDAILREYVEGDRTRADLVADGYDAALVTRIAKLVDLAEYKRRQTPPGVRVTAKAFGKDRRLPITNGYRG
jgi:NAD+ synthase (glutamine-hydrolysing)